MTHTPVIMESPNSDAHASYVHHIRLSKQRPIAPPQSSPSTPSYYRPIGNPTPLGLCAFATTAFTAGVINAQLVPATASKLIIPLAFFYGGIVLFFSGVWELLRNNHFAGTSFSSYGAFWVGRAFFDYSVASSIPKEDLRIAVGTIQFAWTVFTFIMMVASFRTNVVTRAVFVLIEIGSIFITTGKLADIPVLVQLGGWIGMAYGVLAWYGALSNLLREVWQQDVLPIRTLARKPQMVQRCSASEETLSTTESPHASHLPH